MCVFAHCVFVSSCVCMFVCTFLWLEACGCDCCCGCDLGLWSWLLLWLWLWLVACGVWLWLVARGMYLEASGCCCGLGCGSGCNLISDCNGILSMLFSKIVQCNNCPTKHPSASGAELLRVRCIIASSICRLCIGASSTASTQRQRNIESAF